VVLAQQVLEALAVPRGLIPLEQFMPLVVPEARLQMQTVLLPLVQQR
jgi:hypothetical protein